MIYKIFMYSVRAIINKWKIYLFNIVSLAMGMVTMFLATQMLFKEKQTNRIFSKSERIYRINTKANFEGSEQMLANSLALIGPFSKDNFAEVESYTRLKPLNEKEFSYENEDIKASIVDVDSNFFTVFDFPLLNSRRLENNSVYISKSVQSRLAKKSILDNTISVNDEILSINNIIQNVGDFEYGIYKYRNNYDDFDWVTTYIVLNKNFKDDIASLQTKLNKALISHLKGQYDEGTMDLNFELENLNDTHFSNKLYENKITISKEMLFLLVVVSVILLSLATLNHINLFGSLKASSKTEMIVRRVFGASKFQIALHFIIESFVLFLISLVLAYFFALFFSINNYFGMSEIDTITFSYVDIIVYISFSLLLGALSGFLIMIFHYGSIFHNRKFSSKKSFRYLLLAQLALGFIAICNLASVNNQLNTIKNYELGFNIKNVLVLKTGNNIIFYLKNQLSKGSHVKNVATCSYNSIPGIDHEIQIFRKKSNNDNNEGFPAIVSYVDNSFFKSLEIGARLIKPFKKGRAIVNHQLGDEHDVKVSNLINGKEVVGFADNTVNRGFYFEKFPEIYLYDSAMFNALLIRCNDNRMEKVIQDVSLYMNDNFPDHEFDLMVLDDIYYQAYQPFYRITQVIGVVSLAILLISFFGLYSTGRLLYNFSLKEFAVRYVLGASNSENKILHTHRLLKIIFVAILIALPVAIVTSSYWLSDFAIKSRTEILDYFTIIGGYVLISIVLSILIMLTTKFHPLEIIKNNEFNN